MKNISTKIIKTCPECRSYKIKKTSDRNLFLCEKCGRRFSKKKISDELKILECFALEISARKTSLHLEFSYNKVKTIYDTIRTKMYEHQEREFTKLLGELELDESYFGGTRKGKRGRGAKDKMKVFGILERKNIVYTVVVEHVDQKTLLSEIEKASVKGSVYYTDTFKSYNNLHQFGKHHTINHTAGEFKKRKNIHTNGIEGFWSFAKERMLKYHGVSKARFNFYLKEMEFRYNFRKEKMFDKILEIYYNLHETT